MSLLAAVVFKAFQRLDGVVNKISEAPPLHPDSLAFRLLPATLAECNRAVGMASFWIRTEECYFCGGFAWTASCCAKTSVTIAGQVQIIYSRKFPRTHPALFCG